MNMQVSERIYSNFQAASAGADEGRKEPYLPCKEGVAEEAPEFSLTRKTAVSAQHKCGQAKWTKLRLYHPAI
jgi:hypothetical protein